jgi:hypothetical protein
MIGTMWHIHGSPQFMAQPGFDGTFPAPRVFDGWINNTVHVNG